MNAKTKHAPSTKTPLKLDGEDVDTSITTDNSPKLHRPPSDVGLQDPVGLKFIGTPEGNDIEDLFINTRTTDWSATMNKGDVVLIERSLAISIIRDNPNKGYWKLLEIAKK